MSFLERRMFADAGAVNQYYYVDKKNNQQVPLDQNQLLQVLSSVRIPELEALISNPDVIYSPQTQELFRQVVGTRKAQVSRVSPSLMEFGKNVPSISPGSALENIGGQLKDASLELIERGANLGQMFMADSKGPQDIFQSERYPFDNPRNVPGTIMSAPGFLPNKAASLKRGYTDEELASILNRAQSGEIQDFQSEINDVVGSTEPSTDVADTAIVTEANDIRMDGSMVPQPKGPDLAKIAAENNMTIEQVERIVAEQNPLLEDSFDELNFSSVDDFGNSLSSGETLSFSGGAPEMEARRLAYEKSLIGVDEFGFPIERPDAINKKPERPTSISDFTEELASIKPVNVLKTEEDSKIEIEEKFLPTLPDIDLSITQQEADQINQEESSDPVTRKLKEPGFFGSDNFLNFIRNVGGELVRTGQFGTGLASGAAKAAEERAARELMADQEERKYQKEIELATAKARATAGSDLLEKPKDIRELNTQIKTNMSDLEGGVAATGFVDLAIETLEEALESGESVGGFFGALNAAGDSVSAFFGNEKSFADQSAQTKIKKLVEVVRQKNLQAILGESGRTISDKDRAIILQVFGDLELTEDPNVTLGKLRASRASLAQNNIKLKGLIEDNTSYMFTQGTLGQGFGTKLLPQYQRIRTLDPLASQAAAILAQFMGETIYSGNIEEVDL
tara:strand:+ start:1251 stop:3293 length:2043 start_codon:yes stop_codon:yes gene_type:complete